MCTVFQPKKNRFVWLLLLVLGLVLPLSGCSPQSGAENLSGFRTGGTEEGARLSVFLNVKDHPAPQVRLWITSIEICKDNIWIPLASKPLEIDVSRMDWGQTLLAEGPLTPGRYDKVRIRLEKAGIHVQGKMVFPALKKTVLEISISSAIDLEKGNSQCLFITWDVSASLLGTAFIDPVMAAVPQSTPLVAGLAYVACPDIDTVYMVRTDKCQVCGSMGIAGQPTYLALDCSRNRLYVLATRKSAINVIELSTSRLVDVIRIPLTMESSFMTMSPDGLWAYILDERGNYLIRMDLQSGSLAGRVHLGNRPQYAAYLPDHQRLAVSSGLSQAVFLLNPESLKTMETVPVGSSPQGLLVWRDLLYIAESDSNTISVYDLETRQVRARMNAGLSPRRLLLSGVRIYVSNYEGGSLSVLLPGQLSVSQGISVGGTPMEMASSTSRRWLYVGNQESQDLTVIDLTSNRLAGRIPLGAAPLGLAIVE